MGNKKNLLKPDEITFNILNILLKAYAKCDEDKAGVVSHELNEVVHFFNDYGISFGSGQLATLENIGLFCKLKQAANNQVLLQFELNDVFK